MAPTGGNPPVTRFHRFWALDPKVLHLNHGSFGATPLVVLEAQTQIRRRMEEDPMRFFVEEYEPLLDATRRELAAFVGADPEDLVFVPNATTGINAVVRSLRFEPGDELLTTDHAYNACRNALDYVAPRDGARLVRAPVPFPLEDPDEVVQAVLGRVTARTRLALLDHVTSPTGLVLPVERLVPELRQRGVFTLVDGAHALGMLNLDLEALGADAYAANAHKWLCAPKGAAFLHVRREVQHLVHPTVISHGWNSPRRDRSRFQLEFLWTGTRDPSPWLCIPAALNFLGHLFPGGWEELRQRNRDLVLEARSLLCERLGVPEPAPETMIGFLAAVPLPDALHPADGAIVDPLSDVLRRRFRIEVPVFYWPEPPRRLIRISAHAYNELHQYESLAGALLACLQEEARPPAGESDGRSRT
jgi:isopenicillin-N epimerase